MKFLPYILKKSIKMWSFFSKFWGFKSMIISSFSIYSFFASFFNGFLPSSDIDLLRVVDLRGSILSVFFGDTFLLWALCKFSINNSAFFVLLSPSNIDCVIWILPTSYSSSPRLTIICWLYYFKLCVFLSFPSLFFSWSTSSWSPLFLFLSATFSSSSSSYSTMLSFWSKQSWTRLFDFLVLFYDGPLMKSSNSYFSRYLLFFSFILSNLDYYLDMSSYYCLKYIAVTPISPHVTPKPMLAISPLFSPLIKKI